MIRRNGATPKARERNEMFVERVRIAGARSEEGGRDTTVEVERDAQVEMRE